MAKKVIIFDFDGTLADTLPYYVEIMNNLASRYGFKKVSTASVSKLRNMMPLELLEHLEIPLIKVYSIVKTVKAGLNKKIELFSPTVPIRKTLLKLQKDGYRLGIITSNSKDNVEKFLKKNSLNYFDFVYSGSNIFGKGRVISGFLRKQNIRPAEAVYVGDEARDIEAARKAGIDMVAVSWGFNSKQALEKMKPDFLVNTPGELAGIFKKTLKKSGRLSCDKKSAGENS